MNPQDHAAQCPKCDSFHFTGRFCDKCGHSDFFKGTLVSQAIQCTNGGKTGTFLFTGASEKVNIQNPLSRCSPIFEDLWDLHEWTRGKFTVTGKRLTKD